MHQAVKFIHENADILREHHPMSDDLGKLTDQVASILRDSGGMRLLQARQHGGHQASPADFFEWVRAVGRYNPSAGWVAGVVGIHPWEIAYLDPDLQNEIFGTNKDTWIASPYMPQGRAVREGDGFRFSGRWQYSTGTDHCDWVVLGGIVENGDEKSSGPREVRHFFLPRGDYQIVDDSWNVMGLRGTGSKDILIKDAFVPEYRTVSANEISEGKTQFTPPEDLMYRLPFWSIFSAAIASAAFGIAEGALETYREYMENRVSMMGVVGKTDPFQQEALAEVEADLAAGIVHLDHMFAAWTAQIENGDPVTTSQRLEFRRNQVRAVQRVLFGVDKLFSRAGSAGVWTTRPLERYWRDLRTGGSHVCLMSDTIYAAWANDRFKTGVPSFVIH